MQQRRSGVPKQHRKNLSLRIGMDLWRGLYNLAQSEGISLAFVIQRALVDIVNRGQVTVPGEIIDLEVPEAVNDTLGQTEELGERQALEERLRALEGQLAKLTQARRYTMLPPDASKRPGTRSQTGATPGNQRPSRANTR